MATHMHVPEEHKKNEGDAEERASEETEKPYSQLMNLQKGGSVSDKSGERDAWKQAYHEEMERTLKERFAVVVQELTDVIAGGAQGQVNLQYGNKQEHRVPGCSFTCTTTKGELDVDTGRQMSASTYDTTLGADEKATLTMMQTDVGELADILFNIKKATSVQPLRDASQCLEQAHAL